MKRTVLLETDLAVAEGKQEILDRMEIAAGVTGGKHYHPGEEFVYVLERSIFLGLEGKPDVITEAGDACHMPLEQVHFGKITTEPGKIFVFQVQSRHTPPGHDGRGSQSGCLPWGSRRVAVRKLSV